MRPCFILFGLALTSACSPAPQASPQIFGGESPSLEQQDERTLSTVGLVDGSRKFFCSGTMIAEDLVLTAAHCLTKRGTDLQVAFGRDLNDASQATYRQVRGTRWHPDFEKPWQEERISKNDLALVLFDPLPAGTSWRPAPMGFDGVGLGETVALAGFGIALRFGWFGKSGILRQALMTVDELPGKDAHHVGLFGVSAENVNARPGDSGGPAYRTLASGGFELVGVSSMFSHQYHHAHYTDLSHYEEWIEDTSRDLRHVSSSSD